MRRPLLALLFIPVLVAAAIGGQLTIPKVVHSEHGDIPIVWAKSIRCSGVDARGCYDAAGRKVWILTGMSLDSTLQTIRHEQCHVSLYEAGIRVDSVSHYSPIYVDQGGPEDYVCDALGWAWLREKRHGH